MADYQFNSKEHLHTLRGVALTGTSSVVGVLSKPLSWWASGQAVGKMGWLNPKHHSQDERIQEATLALESIKAKDPVSFLQLLDEAYKAHAQELDRSARDGTNLHEELERFVKGEMKKSEVNLDTLDTRIMPFVNWAKDNVKRFLWSEAHAYSERLWCGGVSDAGAELHDGTFAVIDFKSAKACYPHHLIQAAGYAIQIEENGLFSENGEHNKKLDKPIGALIIVPFGAEVVTPEIRTNVEEYKKGFECAVQLYRLLGTEKQQ